ncbi:4Fe-4S ferredoxin iron-sulfur binding domain-containing protein [Caldithrix abyssi DSM 13497]|uniref:4Fe-4S ferredoxin iron-sulfur binding domain-containing protein n=1 Tax=Caldithrix abyssi DSM 13497 TaxID=880073 RepID=H1XR77_CALAY|nr:4Fe-4S dicluster domain-containing protein [Caldithrix abyssi]APF17080.1 Fe-S-cluster-containing dehydrogenase component [Caldithrix abyssi DSM 13497]EHO41228.1 4Fe-4S ferredoxin iron-sulfur binding domain-containing protein [Caldithrix abyssi DSM 13497]
MSQTRRSFLKAISVASLTAISPKKSHATPKNVLSDDRFGVLVDTTVCIGCRQCEYACKVEHGMEAGNLDDYQDRSVFQTMRRPDHTALTVVNAYKADNPEQQETTVKVQCMHCDHPACVSACIVGAFTKQENGAVIWDESRCIGCRYCMVACPFQVPAFEYHKAIEPKILKCDFCYDRRTSKGKMPACVEICPTEALTFGKRYELIQVAHERIRKQPERYIDHVFGEHEVAGTSWLYLAGQDFLKLDFPDVGTDPAPGATEPIQHAIFKFFVPPVALYALLGGIMWLGKQTREEEE